MKWMLVVLVSGVTPVSTNLVLLTSSVNVSPPKSKCASIILMHSRLGIAPLPSMPIGGGTTGGRGICKLGECWAT